VAVNFASGSPWADRSGRRNGQVLGRESCAEGDGLVYSSALSVHIKFGYDSWSQTVPLQFPYGMLFVSIWTIFSEPSDLH